MRTKYTTLVKRFHKEQSQPLYNADQPNNSTYSNETQINEAIPNTPFRIIGNHQGWFIAMGNNRLTNTFKNRQQAERELKTNPWELTVNIIVTILAHIKEMEKTNQDNLPGNTIETELTLK